MRQPKIFALAAALAAVFVMAGGALAQTIAPAPKYTITGSGTPIGPSFTADKNGTTLTTNQQIQTVINAIITDARQSFVGPQPVPAPFGTIAIQFGNGSDVLDIGTQMASFDGGGSSTGTIFLSGKITSAIGASMVGSPGGTILVGSGISVESSADIASNGVGGNAIGVDGGKVKIIGGTVAVTNANGGNAIDFSFYSGDGGSVIFSGSPTITGNINFRAGALSVDPTFAPAGKQYRLMGMGTAGSVAVVDGANFISNFTLVNSGNFTLKISGNDLVLDDGSGAVLHNIVFLDSLGGNTIYSQTVAHGGKVQKPADPTRAGYIFVAWYAYNNNNVASAAVLWDFETDVVTSDIVFYAKWEVYDPTSVRFANRANAAKPSGISVNGTSLRIVGAASSTPVRIYDMRGKLLMSRSAMPNEVISVSNLARGTYVVKALGNSVKIVR
jgi:uncharacterized repeat protein (TIGR02543 family)